MTRLAVSIMVEDLDSALAAAARAAERGADLVEYRIDRFHRPDQPVAELLERSTLPCILTCRDRGEGGAFDGLPAEREALFARLAEHATHAPAYIDVELAAYESSPALRAALDAIVDHPQQAKPSSTGLILSAHDFTGRPAGLYNNLERMAALETCRVVKLAWHARSLRDNLEAFDILAQRLKPTIALCMGEFGLPSRVLAKKFGALLTFAAADARSGTAPGQPTLDDLKHLYRWDAIDAQTEVFGVIGWPVAHSISPAIHNAGFDAIGYNGVYLPMPIPPEYEHFKATVGSWLDAGRLDFRGASVTIPHKENLLRFVREEGGEIEPLAAQIGAANTLTRRADGSLYASNTDYAAALDSACNGMGITRDELQDKRVAVVGAGGAARAIVAGFAHHGATVVIYNRTHEKAQELAAEFTNAPGSTDIPGKVVAARLEKLCDSCCHLFINCTPVGMHPNTDATPMPRETMLSKGKGWEPGKAVFDTIYNPIETRLLREAAEAGCTTIRGADMFIRQAAGQFELWTGREAPLDVFRKVVYDKLGAG